jgi:hypothetical protein
MFCLDTCARKLLFLSLAEDARTCSFERSLTRVGGLEEEVLLEERKSSLETGGCKLLAF